MVEWNAAGIDLAAAKAGHATTVTSGMTLPSTLTLLNGDQAVKADRRYTLLTLPEGYTGPIPTVTGVPPPWIISVSGRQLRLVYPYFAMSFR